MVRIVLITGAGRQHRYLANRLSKELPLVAIVVDHGSGVSTMSKLKRIWKRYSVSEIFGRIGLLILRWACADTRRKEILQARVFGDDCIRFHRIELVKEVRGVNTPEGVRTIAEQRPDIVLVFGTGIVGSQVLSLADRMTLNLHTGISPNYRGTDCAFWPIHNGEPELLGATVHECTAELDGGSVFATGRPRLMEDDCIVTVFARCVVVGAEVYVRVVKELINGTIQGRAQDLTVGREYRAANRGLLAELRARRLIRAGLVRRYVRSHRSNLELFEAHE